MEIIPSNLALWLGLVLVGLMLLDVATGYVHAVITDTVQSARMRQGFWKKGAELAYIIIASFIDVVSRWLLVGSQVPEAISTALLPITITGASSYLIIMEVTSIYENMKAITGYDPTAE